MRELIDFFDRKNTLFKDLENNFNKMWAEIAAPPTSKCKHSYPKANVYETADNYVWELSVPGLKKEDLSVKIKPSETSGMCPAGGVSHNQKYPTSNFTLVISGKASDETKSPKDSTYHYRELKQSAFVREFSIWDHVDETSPKVSLSDGILTLSFPLKKKKEEPKTEKVIEIS